MESKKRELYPQEDTDLIISKIQTFFENEFLNSDVVEDFDYISSYSLYQIHCITVDKQTQERIDVNYSFHLHLRPISAWKSVIKTDGKEIFVAFTKRELRFMDTMGFELTYAHKKNTNQKIEDWIYDD